MVRTAKAQPLWDFDATVNGETGTISVHYGTGHWCNVMNMDTGELTRSIYVFEATWKPTNGNPKDMPITKAELRWLRKTASQAALG